jgi:hypothetical protein
MNIAIVSSIGMIVATFLINFSRLIFLLRSAHEFRAQLFNCSTSLELILNKGTHCLIRAVAVQAKYQAGLPMQFVASAHP